MRKLITRQKSEVRNEVINDEKEIKQKNKKKNEELEGKVYLQGIVRHRISRIA
jgi:hypothetical protein